MKKLTFLWITILIIYLIYSFFKVNKINYVTLSIDNGFNNYISTNCNDYFNNNSILNVYQDIKNNRTIKIDNEIYYLKKVLRESDVLVINLGMNELTSCFSKYNIDNNYSCFNNIYSNISLLINEVNKYAYGKILFLGYYNPTNYYDSNIDRFFYDIKTKLKKLMVNNIIYIDLYELVKENNYKENNSSYLNTVGNKKIANIIEYYLN